MNNNHKVGVLLIVHLFVSLTVFQLSEKSYMANLHNMLLRREEVTSVSIPG